MSLQTSLKSWLLDQGTLHWLKQAVPPSLKLRIRMWLSGENRRGLDFSRLAKVRVVKTMEELDGIIAEVKAPGTTDDMRRALFTTFHMDYEKDLPADPFSPAYRDRQMALYNRMTGKSYAVDNELSPIAIDQVVNKPYPYSTRSTATVGNQLIAIGYIIKQMALPKDGRVLDFGMGWANTTEALARMGFHTVGVDIDPRFVEGARQRMARIGVTNCEFVHSDYVSYAEQAQKPFDAVLFFESFHHCFEHQRLIAAFERLIAPGGMAVFAAEPITTWFPVPWGLRMDGESLLAIRQNGWMELGFKESYFRDLLARHGWAVTRSVCADSPFGVVYVAKRAQRGA